MYVQLSSVAATNCYVHQTHIYFMGDLTSRLVTMQIDVE